MALTANGITFFESYYEALKDFPDDQTKWLACEILLKFSFEGSEPNLDSIPTHVKMWWKLVKPNAETNLKKRKASLKKTANTQSQDVSPSSEQSTNTSDQPKIVQEAHEQWTRIMQEKRLEGNRKD